MCLIVMVGDEYPPDCEHEVTVSSLAERRRGRGLTCSNERQSRLPGSHLVVHIRKQTSDRARLAKGANDNFTALHKKLLEVANED